MAMARTVERGQLTRTDWILAGQMLMRRGGAPMVKLAELTRRLKVTTGSFYHHFTDFREYLDALADYYGTEHVDAVIPVLEAERDPFRRMVLMGELAERMDIASLDTAMRVWASTNARARAAVTKLDGTFLTIMRGAFGELGFSDDEARLRAEVAFASGVGQALVFGAPRARRGDRVAALRILAQGAPGSEGAPGSGG